MLAKVRPETETGKAAWLRQVAALIEEFARAAKQSSQYPAYHPMMEAALARALQALHKIFPPESPDLVRLTTSRAGIIFNGDPLPAAGAGLAWFNRNLRRRAVKTLFLHSGLQTLDVEALLQLLFTEAQEIVEKGGAAAWLADRGIRNIGAEQQDYRRLLRESEAALLQMAPHQEGGDVQQMVKFCMGVLEKKLDTLVNQAVDENAEESEDPQHSLPARLTWLLDFISATPSEDNSPEAQAKSLSMGWQSLLETEITPSDFLATSLGNLIQVSLEALGPAADPSGSTPAQKRQRAEWEQNLNQILRRLDRELRARLFRVPVVVSPGHKDALSMLAGALSPEEVVEDIVFAHPMAAAGEASSALSRLFRRIMPTPARRAQIEPLLKARFLQAGMPEETYRNVIGLLLDGLAKEYSLQDSSAPFRLREEEAGALGNFAPIDLSDLLVTLQPQSIERSHTEMLLNLLGYECAPAEYAGLCAELASCAKRWQEREVNALALELLRGLAAEARASERPPSYRLIATSALARLDTPDFVSWIAQNIPSATEEGRVELLNLLGRLGENAGNNLLQFIYNEPDENLARAAARAIFQSESDFSAPAKPGKATRFYTNEGNESADSASEAGAGRNRLLELLSDTLVNGPADRSLKVVRILLSTRAPQAVQPTVTALRHSPVRVGIGILQAVGEFKPPGGEKIFFAGLEDGHWEIRAKAARALGDLAADLPNEAALQAVRQLSRLAKQPGLNPRALSIRLTAIESLGRLGREEAMPLLAGLLGTQNWLFPKAVSRICSSAAAALANIPSPHAARMLESGCSSRRRAVAKACRTALARWRELWERKKTLI